MNDSALEQLADYAVERDGAVVVLRSEVMLRVPTRVYVSAVWR